MEDELENSRICINFNNEYTHLVVSGDNGCSGRKFNLNTSDTKEIVTKTFDCDIPEVNILEQVPSSNLLLYVPQKYPRKVMIYDRLQNRETCDYTFPAKILALEVMHDFLVICFEEKIQVHEILEGYSLRDFGTLSDLMEGSERVFATTKSGYENLIGYPSGTGVGILNIVDLKDIKNKKCTIAAHESRIAAVAFSSDGVYVATASEKGTLIRVFYVDTGSKAFEFRRGHHYVTINSLAFSTCSKFLCCSSNTETVHVFKLRQPLKETVTSYWGLLTSYLPVFSSAPAVEDYLNQEKSFATAKIEGVPNGCKTVVGINTAPKAKPSDPNRRFLYIASQNGQLQVFVVPEYGGECHIVCQEDLH